MNEKANVLITMYTYNTTSLLIYGGNGNPLQYFCLENPIDRKPNRLQSVGSQRVGHDQATNIYGVSLVAQMVKNLPVM